MKLVLIGIPGSGKSTQGNLLSAQLNIPYLSTGHIFRQIAKEKTNLGSYVKLTLASGSLIPDEKTMPIVQDYLSRPEYKNGYILDGFPRTVNQARKFKNNFEKVIYLEIPDKEALWRLAFRNDTLRNDNTVDAIKKRIEIFHKVTKPVIKFYEKKDKLLIVDGTKSVKDVNSQILKALGKQYIKNSLRQWHRREKIILAIVGLPGSGKSQAASFFAAKKVPVLKMGDIVNKYIDEHNLAHEEDIHRQVRENLRKKYGMDALARLNEEKIKVMLEKNFFIVLDGMRSWEEYAFLKKKFTKAKTYIVGLFASKNIRYKRIRQRSYRSHLYGEERDIHELLKLNMAFLFGQADFIVENNKSVAELESKLEALYRTLYFGQK